VALRTLDARLGGGPAIPILAVLCLLSIAGGALSGDVSGRDSAEAQRPIPVIVDIRPGLCPNHMSVESHLTIPVAVLGSLDFDAVNVDAETVRLSRKGVAGEVGPVDWVYSDVGTPVVGGLCACHKLRGDGIDDLELNFAIDELATTLGLGTHVGETIPLTLSGKMITGQPITGVDCAFMISEAWTSDELGDGVGMLTCSDDGSGAQEFEFAYYTGVSDRVTFAIYDVRGQVVATLADMDMAPGIYHAAWNGTGRDKERVPAGTYFARVSNSGQSETRKIAILQ
jgi:hypothetical protein